MAERDPKLAAVEAELASDRGEVYDPDHGKHEVHALRSERNVDSLIEQAVALEERKQTRRNRFTWASFFTAITFGLWKPQQDPKKDYRYEFDPNTGGTRRVYLVRDKKK